MKLFCSFMKHFEFLYNGRFFPQDIMGPWPEIVCGLWLGLWHQTEATDVNHPTILSPFPYASFIWLLTFDKGLKYRNMCLDAKPMLWMFLGSKCWTLTDFPRLLPHEMVGHTFFFVIKSNWLFLFIWPAAFQIVINLWNYWNNEQQL